MLLVFRLLYQLLLTPRRLLQESCETVLMSHGCVSRLCDSCISTSVVCVRLACVANFLFAAGASSCPAMPGMCRSVSFVVALAGCVIIMLPIKPQQHRHRPPAPGAERKGEGAQLRCACKHCGDSAGCMTAALQYMYTSSVRQTCLACVASVTAAASVSGCSAD